MTVLVQNPCYSNKKDAPTSVRTLWYHKNLKMCDLWLYLHRIIVTVIIWASLSQRRYNIKPCDDLANLPLSMMVTCSMQSRMHDEAVRLSSAFPTSCVRAPPHEEWTIWSCRHSRISSLVAGSRANMSRILLQSWSAWIIDGWEMARIITLATPTLILELQ